MCTLEKQAMAPRKAIASPYIFGYAQRHRRKPREFAAGLKRIAALMLLIS